METKMIKLEFAHLAQKAILEKETNLLSLINLVHQFGTQGFPFVIPEFTLAFRTSRDINNDPPVIEMNVKIQQEDKILLNNKIKINFLDKSSNNAVIRIHQLVVEKPAPVEIICERDGEELIKIEVPIERREPVVEQQQAS
jgi:hypothetical protein